MKTLLRFALLASLVGGMTSDGHADTIVFDNLGQSSDGVDNVQQGGAFLGPLYDSFSTGSFAGSLTVTQVSLLLKVDSGLVASGTTTIGLYSDSSQSPGTLLATIGTFSDTSLTTTLATYDFVAASPRSLTPNTRYWIGLTPSPASAAMWSYATSDGGTGVAGQYFHNQDGSFGNSYGPYQMSVAVAPVPEPSTWGMAVVGVACGGWRMLKGRRRAT